MTNGQGDLILMPTPKKRPSKAAKAAKKILEESKLLNTKHEREQQAGSEFKPASAVTHVNKAANKPRPDKKRGYIFLCELSGLRG